MQVLVLSVIVIGLTLADDVPSRLINTSQGPVRGYKDPEYDIFAFYNIPYATIPSGVDRFKGPLPRPAWKEPFDAINKEIICPQPFVFDLMPKTIKIQEDCLIANIYIPNTENDNIPVVVYVHGGAYITGYGNMAYPKTLVSSKKVLVVTFNYRLAGHGFLCLGTEDIPGNAGMKDQVALLRWVQENIKSFGGNPNDVTLIGGSAGASAVDLLMISKVTKGLFHKVVPESGANTAAFSVQSDPIRVANEYAKLLGYDGGDDIYDLENFFKSISIERLNSLNTLNRTDATFLVSPCVERKTGEEVFLDDSPVNILRSGNYQKLPMLYGFANMEGLLIFLLAGGEIKKRLADMNDNFSTYLPADLTFKNDKEKNEVAEKIKTFFFGKSVDEEDILDYVNYYSDIYFAYSTLRSVKLQVDAGNAQIYLYEYSFTDDNTPYIPYTKVRGANHCSQAMAVWDPPQLKIFNNVEMSEEYKENRRTLREMWLNFITTGKPVPEGSKLPEWPSVGRKWSPHMSLGKAIELRGSLLKERTLFWEDIYTKYYRSPQPPPPPPPKRTEL